MIEIQSQSLPRGNSAAIAAIGRLFQNLVAAGIFGCRVQIGHQISKDIYELRSVLDGFLVESVVPCITPETIRRMEALIEKQQQCLDNDDKSGFAEHDDAFHSLLYDCCPNAVAVRIARQRSDSEGRPHG